MVRAFRWKKRHSALGVVFAASSVSFLDRVAMSVAVPYIAADFHLTDWQIGVVMSAFFAGYALTQIPGGILADLFGVRKVAVLAMVWWSLFTALTGFAANFLQIVSLRFLFGLGEGIFPAAAFKTIAVWFPKRERATATAVFLAANPFGSAIAPLAVVAIVSAWGWRSLFHWLFFPGILLAILFWFYVPDSPAKSRAVSKEELAEIEDGTTAGAGASDPSISFRSYLKVPSIIHCFFILFTFDIALLGFTTWLPTYLVKARGFSMSQMGVTASLPYILGIISCLLGGWISDKYFSSRRKVPVIAGQIVSAVLLYATFSVQSPAGLVVCVTLGGAALLFSLAAVWALPMSIVPRELMGVTGGFINVAGQLAAFISPLVVGYLVESSGGNYGGAFILLTGALAVSTSIVIMVPGKRPEGSSEQQVPAAR